MTGGIAAQCDPLGNCTTYTYDANGNRLTATDPLGRITTCTYDALDDPTTITDPLTTTTVYDAKGNLQSVSRLDCPL